MSVGSLKTSKHLLYAYENQLKIRLSIAYNKDDPTAPLNLPPGGPHARVEPQIRGVQFTFLPINHKKRPLSRQL